MKTVYISHSVGEEQQSDITKIARQIRERGFEITSGVTPTNAAFFIEKSDLFLGLATANGQENERVINEWKIAEKNQIPTLFLAENDIIIPDILRENSSFAYFDPNDKQSSLKLIKKRISESEKSKNGAVVDFFKKYWLWIILGPVLLIAATLFITSSKKTVAS